MKMLALGLDAEEDGDGVIGPGADLEGVADWERGGFAVEGQGPADGAAEFGPVEPERGDVSEGEIDFRAAGWVRPAETEERRALTLDPSPIGWARECFGAADEIGAARFQRAWDGEGWEGIRF